MKKLKSRLDERQKLELYSVYKWGYWVLFWGILAQIVVGAATGGQVAFGFLSSYLILLAGAVVTMVGSIRRGIWSEYFKPTVKNNLISSFCAGLFVFLLVGALPMLGPVDTGDPAAFDLLTGAIIGAITFTLGLALNCLLLHITKKRAAKLESEYGD